MPDQKKKVPLGKPLELTDEQLDALAQVTPADIEKAKVAWRSNAPEKFKTLLDAQTIDEEPKS
jgi:hypothetical protein